MEFAVDLGRDDHAAALELLSSVERWSRPAGRAYFMGSLRLDAHPLLEGCRRAFFLKIEPGGHIHRHTDDAAKACDTDLIVVSTNDGCVTCWEVDGVEHSLHLALGKRYRMRDRGVTHWAVNNGETDRVHLLIDYQK